MKSINKVLFFLALLISGYPSFAEDFFTEDCCFDSCKSCGEWFATVGFVYWKAHEDNLEFAQPGVIDNASGNAKNLDWRWSPGFKVGVGYNFENTDWDTYLNYTWYYSHASGSADGPLLATFTSEGFPFQVYSSASSDWHLHYQTLDFEIGNWFCYNSNFTFRPNFGFRAALTRDSDKISYVGTTTPGIFTIAYRQKFDGIGPRIGLDTHWNFCNNWFLFGDGAAALVWGRYEVVADIIVFSPIFEPAPATTRHNFDAVKALGDIKIGLGWETYFCNDYHFSFQLAWEQRIWFNHNEYPRFRSGEPTYFNEDSDLTLYGITLTACLEF